MAEDGRRQDEDERSPALQHQMFVVMEDLLDKLKLLDYEEQVLEKHNMKPLSRHYFVASSYTVSNLGEQFYMFSVIAAWLITLCGRSFETPQEYDDPNVIVSNILTDLRAQGGLVDFPPFKLKSGSGEHVCYVLDHLAEEALRCGQFVWKRRTEAVVGYSEAWSTVSCEQRGGRSNWQEVSGLRPEMILESVTDSAEWNLEVERVLSQLKVSVHTDIKDWRSHVSQMLQHQDGIKSSLKEAKAYLDKLLEEISKTQEKVNSREKYINSQLQHLITDYRNAQAKFCEAKELYQWGSGGVTERTRTVAEISEELEKVKQEIDEKGSSMSDGAPVVKIRQSLTKLKQEIQEMDVRMGVVEYTLLQAKLKEKNKMTRDMHATHITETTTQTYS
ncbi:intraflagellar transport protein 57 homolog [Ictalurus furcatus]|uniref:intraflagellar transport protein 57 homolog n=1 Tax=Ictalurus furcatus TaxID=66913 RepID=UPI002350CE08|nr:intraflagellar transport protein 57 homolog [Ictalurus furcatus]